MCLPQARPIYEGTTERKEIMSRLCKVTAAILMLTCPTHGQRLGSVSQRNVALVRTIYFGPLLPHGSGAPSTVEFPLRLNIPRTAAARGYQISAVASLAFTAAGSAAGGKSIT